MLLEAAARQNLTTVGALFMNLYPGEVVPFSPFEINLTQIEEALVVKEMQVREGVKLLEYGGGS
jgi:hypothetical protein